MGFVLLGVVVGAACKTSVNHEGTTSFLPDAGSATPPATPVLDPLPDTIPYTVATLRGRAPDAKRVIVEGGANPSASSVLPDGTFCVDVPTPNPGSYMFQVFAQNDVGLLSNGSAMVTVAFDPSAPPITGAMTCGGADPAGCAGSVEICGNGRDDDCNGLIDDRDPACVTCPDDALEPNDSTSAPRITPGRYDNLQVCPNNPDYYGVLLHDGETIIAHIYFSTAAGNLDLELLDTDGTTALERSTSVTDDEMVMHTVATGGVYWLHVFGTGGAANTYSLDVQVM